MAWQVTVGLIHRARLQVPCQNVEYKEQNLAARQRGRLRPCQEGCARCLRNHWAVLTWVGVGTYTPYFTDPQGLELWVFLVEKAFAKYHGG